MSFLLDSLIALIGMFICYQLSLAFIGTPQKLKEVLIPTFVFAVIAYISKYILGTTPTIHTILLVTVNSLLLWLFNDIDYLLSLTGSFFTYIAITLGEELIVGPFLLKLGFRLPTETSGIDWYVVNLGESILIVLLISGIKVSKFSLKKLMSSIEQK